MKKLLNLQDVLDMCRVGYPTLYRWRKSGIFPESIGVGKLLWREDQIIEWMNRQPAPGVPDATTPAQQRRKAKAFRGRQEAADAALKRHEVRRKNTNLNPRKEKMS